MNKTLTIVGCAFIAITAAHAATINPPAPLKLAHAPASVLNAIGSMKNACAAWENSLSAGYRPADPEGLVCDAALRGNEGLENRYIEAMVLGGILAILGLIAASAVRAIIVGLWAFRPIRSHRVAFNGVGTARSYKIEKDTI